MSAVKCSPLRFSYQSILHTVILQSTFQLNRAFLEKAFLTWNIDCNNTITIIISILQSPFWLKRVFLKRLFWMEASILLLLCARLINTKIVSVNILRRAWGSVTIDLISYFLINCDCTKHPNVLGSLCLFLDRYSLVQQHSHKPGHWTKQP